MTAGTAAPVAPPPAASPPPTRTSRRTREALAAYGFLSPRVAGMLLLTIGPMVYSLYLSFTRHNLMTPARWVGFDAGGEGGPSTSAARRWRGPRRGHTRSVVYPPGYHAGFEGAFVRAYESVAFGGTSTRDAARAFITEVNAALATT